MEEGLKTTPNSECALNALAIDNPLEYARLYLDGTMLRWSDAEDSLEVWSLYGRIAIDWQSAFHKTSENSGVVCGTFSNRYKDGVTPQTF